MNGQNSQSCGSNADCPENIVQNNVMSHLFKNDIVNVNQSEDTIVLDCTECEDVNVNKQGSSQDNNQTSSDILNKDFIARFKEKRRRALLEKLRNLRGKEKIGSCAIILAKLERLKCDVRKLSAAKLQSGHETGKNTEREECIYPEAEDVETTQDIDHQFRSDAGRTSIKDVGREKMRNSSSTILRLKPKDVDIEVNFYGKANEKRAKQKPAVDVVKTRRNVSTQVGPDLLAFSSATRRNRGVQTSNDLEQHHSSTRGLEKETDLMQFGGEDTECIRRKSRSDIERSERDILKDDVPEQATQVDDPNSSSDFDSIARQARCEFNFKLMIESQQLFPKNIPTAFDRKDQPKRTASQMSSKKGNDASAEFSNVQAPTANRKGVKTPKSNSTLALYNPAEPIRRPSSEDSVQSGQLLEEQRLKRQLSNVLNNLTKSQLDILQSGSPTLRGRFQCESNPKHVQSSNI